MVSRSFCFPPLGTPKTEALTRGTFTWPLNLNLQKALCLQDRDSSPMSRHCWVLLRDEAEMRRWEKGIRMMCLVGADESRIPRPQTGATCNLRVCQEEVTMGFWAGGGHLENPVAIGWFQYLLWGQVRVSGVQGTWTYLLINQIQTWNTQGWARRFFSSLCIFQISRMFSVPPNTV